MNTCRMLFIVYFTVLLFTAEATEVRLSGTNLNALASGDLNGDGRPELALSNPSGNFVAVLFNSGLAAPNFFNVAHFRAR